MPFDCAVFAKNAKKAFYVEKFDHLRAYAPDHSVRRYYELCQRFLSGEQADFTQDDMRHIAQTNLDNPSLSYPYRDHWNQMLLDFLSEEAPDDTYFVLTDHDVPSFQAVVERDGYELLEPGAA